MRFFPPEAALSSVLLSRGYRVLHTCSPMGIIEATNEAIRRGIAEEPRTGMPISKEYGIRLIALRGNHSADVRLRGEDISGETIARFSQGSPGIAIDTSGKDLLTPKERSKLRVQINLVKGLMRRLRRINKFYVTDHPLEGRIIYLDPHADEELTDIEENAIYVLGGVVDKGNRLSGITSKLAERRDAERRKITLLGRIEGVPNTLVGIARVLIYMFRGVPKDLAVLISSPRRALKLRIKMEKDDDFKEALRKLLERRKGLTEYAELPIEALSKALNDLLFRRH